MNRASARVLPAGIIAMLIVAAFFYAGMMVNINDMQNLPTDAPWEDFASGFALVFGLGVWVSLAVLLLLGWRKGEMPTWSAIAAVILLPLSGHAATTAISFLQHGESGLYQLVPALLPPVVAAYALWARLHKLHRDVPPLLASLTAWGLVAILTLAPLPLYMARQIAAHDPLKHAALGDAPIDGPSCCGLPRFWSTGSRLQRHVERGDRLGETDQTDVLDSAFRKLKGSGQRDDAGSLNRLAMAEAGFDHL